MIKITVELWPWGFEQNKRVLGTAEIWNDATATDRPRIGNYQFRINKPQGSVWKTGEIKDFPRIKMGVWDLLFRVLMEAVGYRNIVKLEKSK